MLLKKKQKQENAMCSFFETFLCVNVFVDAKLANIFTFIYYLA